jgi:hypothetical protein
MDSETLERLLLDRSFGELHPDAAALLDAYLAGRSADQEIASHIARTVQATKLTLGDEALPRIKPFPTQRLMREAIAHRRWQLASRITRLAACVLIGIGIHSAWMRHSSVLNRSPTPSNSNQFADNSQPVQIAPAPASSDDAGFWSVKRVYERVGQPRRDTRRRVIWDSPLSTPRLGDST